MHQGPIIVKTCLKKNDVIENNISRKKNYRESQVLTDFDN